jgi:hypothetical protein
MLSNVRFIVLFIFFAPGFLCSQEKEKFLKDRFLHIKVGATFNFVNYQMYTILNGNGTNDFTSTKNIFFSPSFDLEFENHFFKYAGISVDLGFMQTRQVYINSKYPNAQIIPGYDQGLILCNIPHVNINPSFYLSEDTRLYAGFGLYKYYYSFKPTQAGSLFFDLNSEGLSIYSNVGITQSFDIKAYRFTATVNYFGLTRRYDNGIQVALGIAL